MSSSSDTENNIHILHVDDESNQLKIVQKFLTKENPNYTIHSTSSIKKAKSILKNQQIDCCIIDYQMPEMNGIEFSKIIKAKNNVPVIIYTGQGSEEVAEEAFNAGIDDYVRKELDPSHYKVLNKRIISAVEQNKLELILKKSEFDLKLAQEISHTGSYFFEVPDGEVKWSDETYHIVEWDSSKGPPSFEEYMQIIHPKDRELVGKIIEKSIIEAKPFDINYRIITPNGSVKHIRSIGQPSKNKDGFVESIFGTIIDITEIRLSEKKLLKSEERLRILSEKSQIMFYECNLEGQLIFFNKPWASQHGYTVKEMKQKNFKELMTPKAAKKASTIFKKILAGKSIINYVTEHLSKKGETIYFLINVHPLLDNKGKIIGSQGTATNVTENYILERTLRENEEKYRVLVENSPNFVFILVKKQIQFVNKAGINRLGYSIKELTNPNFNIFKNIFSPAKKSKYYFNEKMKGTIIPSYKTVLFTKNRDKIYVSVFGKKINFHNTSAILYILTDISEQKKSEASLIDSEEKYRLLCETSVEGIYQLDISGNYLYVNKAYAKMLGYNIDELLGKSFSIIIGGRHEQVNKNWSILMSGRSLTGEILAKRKNGTMFEAYFSAAPQMVLNKTNSIIGTLLDITEVKTIKNELKESEEKYRNLVETSQDMIFQCDLDGRMTFMNKTWAKEHGYTIEEMQDKNFTDFTKPEVVKRDLVIFKKILTGGSVTNYQTTHITKTGETIYLIFNSHPQYNNKKRIIGTQGTAINITERVKTNNILRENESKYRKLFEAGNDMICVFSKERIILDVNQNLCDASGYSRKELIGMSIEKLVPDTAQKSSHEKIDKLLTGKKIGLSEYYLLSKDGKKIPVEINSKLVKNIHGQNMVIQSHLRNISDRKNSEKEKIHAITHVLSEISHDIRNPLSTINAAAYILKDASGKEKDETLKIITDSVNSADKIINNLMNIEKEIELQLKKIDINTKIKKIISSLIVPKNIEIIIPKNNLPPINVDPNKIQRVFTNIIMNSLQAMIKGGKLVITTKSKNNMVEITFKDTGVGISKQNILKIFTPYYTTKEKGMGLGLVNSKRIIEAHKGNIKIESQEGKGTKITIKLPIN